jgi:hypothetical protein
MLSEAHEVLCTSPGIPPISGHHICGTVMDIMASQAQETNMTVAQARLIVHLCRTQSHLRMMRLEISGPPGYGRIRSGVTSTRLMETRPASSSTTCSSSSFCSTLFCNHNVDRQIHYQSCFHYNAHNGYADQECYGSHSLDYASRPTS